MVCGRGVDPDGRGGRKTCAGVGGGVRAARSGLELARRLYQRQTRDRATGRWLSEAHRRGELGAGSLERLRASRQFAETLALRNLETLAELVLPEVPAEQRGGVLSDMLGAFGGGVEGGLLPCLGVCVRNWQVEAFLAGADGLEGVAETVADVLQGEVSRPEGWVRALLAVVDHLGFDEVRRGNDALGPKGLAASVVRAALREEAGLTEQEAGELRKAVFRDPALWKALGMEVAGGLDGGRRKEIESDLAFWDHELVRGSKVLEQRFAELLLNSSPTPLAMLTAVEYHANHLTSLEPVSCWAEQREGPAEKGDFRERFVTWAPMAPVDNSALFAIRSWIRHGGESGVPDFDLEDLEVLPEDRLSNPLEGINSRRPAWLSEGGWARWKCLEALTVLSRAGLGEMERWNTIGSWWGEGLPLGMLEEEDRYAFVARVIWHLQEYDAGDLNQQRRLQKLAKWLVGQGINQPGRIRGWTRDLQAGKRGGQDVEPAQGTGARPVPRAGGGRGPQVKLKRIGNCVPGGGCNSPSGVPGRYDEPSFRRMALSAPRTHLSFALTSERERWPTQSLDSPMVGVDLGGTKILVGVVDRENQILARAKRSTPAKTGGEAILREIASGVEEAICRGGNHRRSGRRRGRGIARAAGFRARGDSVQRQHGGARLPAWARPGASFWAGPCWSRTTCGWAATASFAWVRARDTRTCWRPSWAPASAAA